MGTAALLATITTQTIATRAMVGAFVTILLILVFYSVLRKSYKVKLSAYIVIVGIVTISSIILLTLAINNIADGGIVL